MHYVKNQLFVDTVTPIIYRLAEGYFNPEDTPNVACSHCSLSCGTGAHDEDCWYLVGQRMLLSFIQIDSDRSLHFDYKGRPREDSEIVNIKNNQKVNCFLDLIKNHLHFLIQKSESDTSQDGGHCVCTVFYSGKEEHDPDCEIFLISNALIKLLSK